MGFYEQEYKMSSLAWIALAFAVVFLVAWFFNQPQLVAITIIAFLILLALLVYGYYTHRNG